MTVPDFLRFMAPEMVPWGAILRSLAVSLFRSFHQCLGRFEVSLWFCCGLIVVLPLHYNLPFTPLWSRCNLAFHGTNVSDVLRSLGDLGNYNTLERVPTLYLPNQPLKILVQNFSQVPKCKVFFQSMQHRAISHQQILPLCTHSKKSQASFPNQECLSSLPPKN